MQIFSGGAADPLHAAFHGSFSDLLVFVNGSVLKRQKANLQNGFQKINFASWFFVFYLTFFLDIAT
jgi:hypothetical protein